MSTVGQQEIFTQRRCPLTRTQCRELLDQLVVFLVSHFR